MIPDTGFADQRYFIFYTVHIQKINGYVFTLSKDA